MNPSRVNEARLNEIVDAWITAVTAKEGSAEYHSNYWAIDEVLDWSLEQPKSLWRFIVAASRRDLTPK